MMRIVAWCFLTNSFLQLGSVWSIDCTASLSSPFSDQTTYSISKDSHVPDVTGSDCEYSWSNNDCVIAHQIDSDPKLVVNNSINDLITPNCSEIIIYTRNCLSEGISHTVRCTPNCTLLALERSQKQREISATVGTTVGAAVGATVGTAVGATVGAALGAILLVGLLCLSLYSKFKDRISRMFNRSQSKCLYTDVKMQNMDPRAAEEEAGKV